MGALASRSRQAGGSEWRGKAPRDNLSYSLWPPDHCQNCTKVAQAPC